jgi:hypothetical protein
MINPASVIPPTLSSVFIDELLLKALRLAQSQLSPTLKTYLQSALSKCD